MCFISVSSHVSRLDINLAIFERFENIVGATRNRETMLEAKNDVIINLESRVAVTSQE